MESLAAGSAIKATGVHKRYRGSGPGEPPALDGFELDVPTGSVHGLLGPNGAGKTTAVQIMTTLLSADQGKVVVAGHDVANQGHQVRASIGLVGQYAAVDEELTGMQNLVMFARLSRIPARVAKTRAAELLEQFGLANTGKKQVSAYSGGMRRRLDLAAALVVAPQILFVDEPTTGLDPVGRRDVWSSIRTLVNAGTTVLLTTQYLEEADELTGHISLLSHGRVVADGTPKDLKAQVGDDWLVLTPAIQTDTSQIIDLLTPWSSAPIAQIEGRIRVPVVDQTPALLGVATALRDANIELADLSIHTPSLDEVFIQLTGDSATDNDAPKQPGASA